MRPTCGSVALLAILVLMRPAPLQAQGDVRLLSADERGVTLRLDPPAHQIEAGPDGRSELRVSGFQALDVPGRPSIPFTTALVALPPGARAVATLLPGGPEEVMADVRLAITGRPVFRVDERLGSVPGREPVPALLDGPWPGSPVEVGEPFTWQRQRLVAVSLRPYRYDEGSRRLWARGGMTVRVDFVGAARAAAGAPRGDPREEPVLREAVLNYEQGRAWREPSHPARRATTVLPSILDRGPGLDRAGRFDEDFPEVRVRIDTTAVYEILYDDLAAAGFPAAVAVDQVSVHRHEFVENVVPPYETIELPIEVEDADNDTFFGPGDRLLVYVQTWAERSRASLAQRAWGDAECVYVTQVAGNGLRLASRPGWRDVTGLTPLVSYPWRQRWEKNQVYYGYAADTLSDQFHWTGITPYYIRTENWSFETNHIDAGRPASFTIGLAGRAPGTHIEWAEIRQGAGPFFPVLDSVRWQGPGELITTVTLPPGTLGEGNVNRLRMWGRGSGSNFDYVGLNYFETTFWRGYRALENYLSCSSADAQGEIQIHATGFADAAVRVYDVTDSLNPVRLTLDPAHIQPDGSEFAVDFQDSVKAGAPHRYLAWLAPRQVSPGAITSVTFPHSPLGTRGAGDYLLIVPQAFLPAVGPLVAMRQAQGLDVVVAPFETVCDEFNGGRKSSYAIKRFVRFASENWNARWVLLVGDGNEDPLNQLGESSTDWIPVQKIGAPVAGPNGIELVPSDPWYVCLGECDLSGSAPALQDLYLGRLPVQTLQQARDVVDKLVAYENLSADQPWRDQLLLSADDDYSDASLQPGGVGVEHCRRPEEQVFRGISETIASIVTDQAGLRRTVVEKFYLENEIGSVGCTNPPSCTCRDIYAAKSATRNGPTPRLLSRLGAGCLWWNFQGHANAYVLSHEDLYVNDGDGPADDKNRLVNDFKPFLFSAFSCHANAFAKAGDLPTGGAALGEELVTRPRSGAIASWASSGFEILPSSASSHINVMLARTMFLGPPHDDYFGGNGARVLLG